MEKEQQRKPHKIEDQAWISYRIERGERDALIKLAETQGRTLSSTTRMVMQKYLKGEVTLP